MNAEATTWEQGEPPEWTLGERFVKARHHRGIKSTAEMAKLLSGYFGREIKPATVGAWERMANKPTRGLSQVEVVQAYSDLLSVPTSYFLARSRCLYALGHTGQLEFAWPAPPPPLAIVD